jgi:hypothetical protein
MEKPETKHLMQMSLFKVFFSKHHEFAEIFEFEVDLTVSMTPLSQKFVFRQSLIFRLGLKDLWQYGAQIFGFGFIMSSKNTTDF